MRAQESGLTRLVHPDVAERLSLSDPQRAKLQEILQERSNALLAAADEAAKTEIRQRFDQMALAELSDGQREQLASDVPDKGLVFQFRDMKWDQVLSWFAKQQDLTLVMDQVPPGSFTYSDTRAYSPPEAVDLLNSVLMTRGYTLVRRERILTLMQLGDSIPLDLLPRVDIAQLAERGRFELISTVFPLDGRSVDKVLAEVKPYLNSYGRITPLAQGRQVLVVENAGKMQTINELIASVPPEKPSPGPPPRPPAPVFAAYGIGDLDADRTYELIRRLIQSENVAIDPRTGVLSAYVVPAQQTAIQAALDAMMEKQATQPETTAVAYGLENISVADFRDQVAAVAPDAGVSATSKRALVVASSTDHQKIEEALAKLDILPVGANDEVRIFDVAPSKIEAFVAALKNFLPNAQIATNPIRGTVIVKGSLKELKTADEVKRLWSDSSDAAVPQVYDVHVEDASLVLELLIAEFPKAKFTLDAEKKKLTAVAEVASQDAIKSRIAAFHKLLPLVKNAIPQLYALDVEDASVLLDLLTAEFPAARFTLDANKKKLMVVADATNQAAVKTRLAELQSHLPQSKTLVPQVYDVDVKDSALVVELLTAEYPTARFTLDAEKRKLTAVAEADSQASIGSRLAEIHQLLPSREEPSLVSYQVQGMTADVLRAALATELVNLRVQVDPIDNRLIVWGDQEQHERIAKVVERLDEKPAIERQRVIVVYPLNHTTATVAKTALDQLSRPVTIVADDKLKQLIVTGTLADHAILEPVIAQMDRAKSADSSPQVRSFALQNLQADRIMPMLQLLWPDMKMSVDATSNTLVVSGTAFELEEFNKAITQMMESPEGKSPIVQTYSVTSGNIATLPTILTQVAPKAIISADPVSRTVTVLTTEELHARVAEAIEQIAQTARAITKPASYMMKPSQLTNAITSLRALYPAIGLSADPATGQLIVLASEPDHAEIAKVIELLLDGPGEVENSMQVFPIERKLMETTEFLTSLRALLPPHVNIQPSSKSNSIVAFGTPDELNLVAEKLKQVVEQLPVPAELTTTVHKLNYAATTTAITILQPLVPKALLVQDPAARTFAVTAQPEDHQKVEDLLKLIDIPRQNDHVTKVYRMNQGTGQAVAFVLSALMPDARLFGDPNSGALLAAATPEQHKVIQSVADEYGGANEEMETQVFSLVRADATSLSTSLKESNLKAKVVVEKASNSLIVTGTPEALDQVEALISQVDGSALGEQVTQFYPVDNASPTTLAAALQTSFPKATVVGDPTGGGIFVTAAQSQQAEIRKLVEQLNAQPTRLPSLQAYPIKHISPALIARVLREALGGARASANVTFNEETKSLFVVGTRENQKIAEQMLKLMDVEDAARRQREMKVFELTSVNGATVMEALKTAFRDDPELIEMQHDIAGSRLYVFGLPEQLERAAKLLGTFAPTPKDVQVLPLGRVDAYMANQAINALFADTPYSQEPQVTVDYDQQRLLVRATDDQLAQIRSLLAQMGAPTQAVQPGGAAGKSPHAITSKDLARLSRVRSVPTFRNAKRVLDELQRIWPELRANTLKVIRPNATQEASTPVAPADSVPPDNAPPATASPSVEGKGPFSPLNFDDQTASSSQESPASDGNDAAPPVVIVVGDDQWTLASDDTEALDQLERVLDLIRSPRIEPLVSSGNYSVYLLHRASADEMQETLTELLRTGPRQGGGESPFAGAFRRTRIVADARTNALIVSGSASDRQLIEELLGVLDSEELMGSLQQIVPTSITLENATVDQAISILRDIYRTQLTTNVPRRALPIPEGVSVEVSTLLQQLNAQAASPVLAMTSDDITNSLILRAPPDLTDEIRKFVRSLDEQTANTPSRRVELIQLKSTNTKSIEQALRRMLSK